MKAVHQVLIHIVRRAVVEVLLGSFGRSEDTNGCGSVDRLLRGLRRHHGTWHLVVDIEC